MKYTLVIIAIIFMLGITAAQCMNTPFGALFLLALVSGAACIVCLKRRISFLLFLAVFIFFLGAAHARNAQELPKSHIAAQFPYGINGLCVLEGYVAKQAERENNRTSFRIKAETLEADGQRRNCSGDIAVSVKGCVDTRCGQRVRLTGELCRRDGTLAMKIAFPSRVQESGRPRIFSVQTVASDIKEGCESIIFKHMPAGAAGIVDAMVLGDKRHISPLIYRSMMKTGTVHILVVSGFNAGIVACTVMLLLKVMRVPRLFRTLLTMPILVLYCFMTGASAPVVRATVMAVSVLTASLLKREPDIFNALATAALGILLFDPNQLFEISFQLSFVSVISLAYIYPRLRTALSLDDIHIRVVRWLADTCVTSFSAWAGTMGIIAYYFKIFSPVTVLANICIVPLASFITLCGFSMIALHYLFLSFVPSVAATCEWAVNLLLYFNSVLVRLPGASFSL